MIIHYIKKIIIINKKIGNWYLIYILIMLIMNIIAIYILSSRLNENLDYFIELHNIHKRR
jgi:hypothetical protein